MLYILRPHVDAQPEGSQEKADMNHAFVRLMELWSRFEAILVRWAKEDVGADADAADGLSWLEQARFVPVVGRFIEVLQARWGGGSIQGCRGVCHDNYAVDQAD